MRLSLQRLSSSVVVAALVALAPGAVTAQAAPARDHTDTRVGSATAAQVSPARPVSRTGVARALPLASSADVGPLPGLIPTRIRWTRWSNLVVHGARTTLQGQVETADGAVPDAVVDVYARPAGTSSWKLLGTTQSDEKQGIFRFDTHKPSWTTDYRVVHEGDLFYGRSQGERHVEVARRVTSALVASGSAFTFSGSVAPSYANRTVRVQRKKSASATWATIASTSTSSTGRWTFRVTAPTSAGTWYYRAVVPSDARFVTSYSGTWTITR